MLKIISSKNANGVGVKFTEIEISESLVMAENISIFGDKSLYSVRIKTEEELESLSKELLESLDNSTHEFVLLGSGADFENKVEELQEGSKILKKVKIVKDVEKKVFDFPAELVAALQKHDKKASWNLLLQELGKKEAEPTHGTCVFAYKSLLTFLNDPKKNSPSSGVKDFSWRQAGVASKLGKRERQEVADKYFNLVLTYHKARMGEGDLAKQLEKWVLEN